MEEMKRKKWVYLFLLCFISMGLGFLCFSLFWVRPRFKTVTLELGTLPQMEASFYLTGASFLHRDVVVDSHDVDIQKPGDYLLFCLYRGKTFEYNVQVRDTIAPLITPLSEVSQDLTLELGEAYSFYDLVTDVSDASGQMELSIFVDDGPSGERIRIMEEGSHQFLLVAEDPSGNQSSLYFQAMVLDTLPPEMELVPDHSYFATGRTYQAMDFATSVHDLSDQYSLELYVNDALQEDVLFEQEGEAQIRVVAMDAKGNASEASIEVIFDCPPRLIGMADQILKYDSDIDLSEYLVAIDNEEGIISDRIVCDESLLDRTTNGDYTVFFSVKDMHGLTTEGTMKVKVDDTLEADSINVSLSNRDRKELMEAGYFHSAALQEMEKDSACELVYPSLINLYLTHNNAWNAGSGFIYCIEDEYIYILTAGHVAESMNNGSQITFCDRDATKMEVAFPYEQLSAENEVAMFRISTKLIPAKCLLDLRECYIDLTAYDEAKIGDSVIAYSGHWQNGGSVIKELKLLEMDSYFVFNAQNCVMTTDGTIGGMSGTPLFDLYGRVLGIVEGRMIDLSDQNKCKAFHLRLDGVESLYERLSSQ